MIKLVLAGPPRSGKSCLREGLKQALRVIPRAPYPYVITACPDGEGSWFQQAMNNDPELAAACKAAYKSKFTPEFVNRIKNSVQNCTLPLSLIDIGGIPSKENYEICASATHIVILAGDDPKTGESWQDRMIPWRKFADDLGLTVIAEIFSDYHGKEDVVEGVGPDGILRGSVHYLERGENVSERPMIQALAEFMVQQIGGADPRGNA